MPLVCFFLLISVLACPGRHREPSPYPPDEIETIEREVHAIVNEYRRSHGLGELVLDRILSGIARNHSASMASGRVVFGHDGFKDRFETVNEFFNRAVSVGENVALNNAGPGRCASLALEKWLESPGHRENLDRDFVYTGIGVARDAAGFYYFTQLFMK